MIRHYHGHLSACQSIDIHPTIDVLLTTSRDSTCRVWDMRTKACIHTLAGHTNTVATVRAQAAEPQVWYVCLCWSVYVWFLEQYVWKYLMYMLRDVLYKAIEIYIIAYMLPGLRPTYMYDSRAFWLSLFMSCGGTWVYRFVRWLELVSYENSISLSKTTYPNQTLARDNHELCTLDNFVPYSFIHYNPTRLWEA